MSSGPVADASARLLPSTWHKVLADEGFRLFFPLAAVYAACWPPLWVLAGLWGLGRIVGVLGWDAVGMVGTAAVPYLDSVVAGLSHPPFCFTWHGSAFGVRYANTRAFYSATGSNLLKSLQIFGMEARHA